MTKTLEQRYQELAALDKQISDKLANLNVSPANYDWHNEMTNITCLRMVYQDGVKRLLSEYRELLFKIKSEVRDALTEPYTNEVRSAEWYGLIDIMLEQAGITTQEVNDEG